MPIDEIWAAEDDDDDRRFLQRAFHQQGVLTPIRFLNDGEELLLALQKAGSSPPQSPAHPSLILLDLNMPRMNGREALGAIRAHPSWRCIPVVVLTTSSSSDDISASYQNGANSFITKPFGYQEMLKIAGTLSDYWLKTVTLPPECPEP
jgi:CheY-like chemotaxis protein